ncbi:hypothetical protein MHLP_03940 [Candidatus Mycoplasma haematolamae str. Purdue]|uniref:Uncharacterized protein n=1 Tax=Mycoplasma haematolamae (strain Purdue) TaxID=1212765 RepID=I7BKF3_MYCHA|nr:hypothetical protein [Candidatus Mycoplasma haematolamae]AFO52368.1 hypothetical protein MHLP_03940 [Candidatus Mycoplasma haematolamae str. Purdue]
MRLKGDYRIVGDSEFARGSVTHIVLDCEGFEEDKKLPDLKELGIENTIKVLSHVPIQKRTEVFME